MKHIYLAILILFSLSVKAQDYKSLRPLPEKRNFVSPAIDNEIERMQKIIADPKLRWLFANCFPNTLDTTIEFEKEGDTFDTFVITGDIHAMWLRDSGAQVWPYLHFINKDSHLKDMIKGVIHRQMKCILFDPYANAFNKTASGSEWKSDYTTMKPELHERKWEIDNLCYPIRLAYAYWRKTGDTSIFDADFEKAMALIVKTFKEQQRYTDRGPYRFMRNTPRSSDTQWNDGWGNPVKPCGLIFSSFRPSDDATIYGFLIPSNMFAVAALRQLCEIITTTRVASNVEADARQLIYDVDRAIKKHAIVEHEKYGIIYAFEIDGFGGRNLMDDANIPSLLSIPYLGYTDSKDKIYSNTRKFVWSDANPYFFKGNAGEGIGGPHIGYDYIWPMSIIMRGITSTDVEEIKQCIYLLVNSDGNTGFMHESFQKDNAEKFTRKWFAWVNTLFGEFILKVEKEHPQLLKDIYAIPPVF